MGAVMCKCLFSGNMRKIYTLGVFLVCGLLLIGADDCKSMNSDQSADNNKGDILKTIIGKEWKLVEIRLSGKTVILDRAKLNAEGKGDIFTMTIDSSKLSGKAAPNRYSTAYQAGPNNSLTLLPVITTLMAPIFEQEYLKEQEYYQYLGGVKSWKLNQKTLELYTTDADKKEAVLVYSN